MAAGAKKLLDSSRIAEHGQYIFIFTSPRSNQIIYSLTRALDTRRSLRQLPFLGRNTKSYPQIGIPEKPQKQKRPGALGRDPWQPLAAISFPSGAQGLAAYKQLREFRKRHELEWNDAEINEAAQLLLKEREKIEGEDRDLDREHYEQQKQYRSRLRPTKQRLKPLERERLYWRDTAKLFTRNWRERAQVVLMTSKANSIADLAAVLSYQDEASKEAAVKITERREKNILAVEQAQKRIKEIEQLKPKLWADGTEESLMRYKALKRERMWLQKASRKPDPCASLGGFYSWLNDPLPPSKRGTGRIRRHQNMTVFTMSGVKIQWTNLLDAQFASSWPESVVHDTLPAGPTKESKYTFNIELQPPTAQTLVEAINEEPEEFLDDPTETVSAPEPKQTWIGRSSAPTEPISAPEPDQTWMERLSSRLKYGSR